MIRAQVWHFGSTNELNMKEEVIQTYANLVDHL